MSQRSCDPAISSDMQREKVMSENVSSQWSVVSGESLFLAFGDVVAIIL